MINIVNIILIVSFYPILPIIYFILRNESKPKKNIILGITLPYGAKQDECVSAICKSFRKHLGGTAVILAVLPLGVFFIKYLSISTTYLMIWLLAAIIAPFVSYTLYHRKLKRLKQEKNWLTSAAGKVMLDTKVSVQPQKQLNIWLFIPPIIFSLIPVIHAIYSRSNWLFLSTYAFNAFLVATFYLFYRILYRQRTEVIDNNTTLSMALTRVRNYNWCKAWIGLAWFTGLYNLFFWLFLFSNTLGMFISTVIYTAVLLFTIINAEVTALKAQEKLTENSGKDLYIDDDKYWINGMFYYNPNDSHTMINSRVGISISMNYAKPLGKIVMGVGIITLLAMPFIGLWMIPIEFTPVRIEVTDTSIEAHHTKLVYTVDLNDVKSFELLDTLPSVSKIVGTNMDTIFKGKYRAKDIGDCELCLNPKLSPFIMIKTEDTIYIFNTASEADTRSLYPLLVSLLEHTSP